MNLVFKKGISNQLYVNFFCLSRGLSPVNMPHESHREPYLSFNISFFYQMNSKKMNFLGKKILLHLIYSVQRLCGFLPLNVRCFPVIFRYIRIFYAQGPIVRISRSFIYPCPDVNFKKQKVKKSVLKFLPPGETYE